MFNEICPVCNKSHFRVGSSSQTLAYYQPVYKDGVNINQDKNTTTTELHCEECGNNWIVKS